MSAMGRACADYEEKLLLKQEAAEEMYEALRQALLCIENGRGHFDCPECVEEMKAALKKAEGRS